MSIADRPIFRSHRVTDDKGSYYDLDLSLMSIYGVLSIFWQIEYETMRRQMTPKPQTYPELEAWAKASPFLNTSKTMHSIIGYAPMANPIVVSGGDIDAVIDEVENKTGKKQNIAQKGWGFLKDNKEVAITAALLANPITRGAGAAYGGYNIVKSIWD